MDYFPTDRYHNDQLRMQSLDDVYVLNNCAQYLATHVENYLNFGALNNARNGLRAERDFWILLEMMSRGNILGIVDHDIEAISSSMTQLPSSATIPDVTEFVFSFNNVLKKGEILVNWLERCSFDDISHLTVNHIGFDSALDEVIGNRCQPNSSTHQMNSEFLKAICLYLRSGQYQKAQQVAVESRIYWLAALFRGTTNCYYSALYDDNTCNDYVVTRLGNIRQPLSILTSWIFVENSVKQRSDMSNDFKMELAIHAALSNNIGSLDELSFWQGWHDRTWSIVKAAHTRNLIKLLIDFRMMKLQRSGLYSNAQADVLIPEKELLQRLNNVVGDVSLVDCVEVFRKNPLPETDSLQSSVTFLQSVLMRGYVGIESFIKIEMESLKNRQFGNVYGCDYLRIVVHLVIWLKISPKGFVEDISSTIDMESFYYLLERYIDHLVETEYYTLVAVYCVFLSRPRRIHKFGDLLLALHGRILNGRCSQDLQLHVLSKAKKYFSSDLENIYFSVVERTCNMGSIPTCIAKSNWISGFSNLSINDRLDVTSFTWLKLGHCWASFRFEANKFLVESIVGKGMEFVKLVPTLLASCDFDKPDVDMSNRMATLDFMINGKHKIMFWHRLWNAMNSIKLFYNLNDRLMEMDDLICERTTEPCDVTCHANAALNSIEECLICPFETCEGFVSLWSSSIDFTYFMVEQKLEEIAVKSKGQGTFPGRINQIVDVEKVLSICSTLHSVHPTHGETISNIMRLLSIISQQSFGQDFGVVSNLVSYCQSYLENLVFEHSFCKVCTSFLLNVYFQVSGN